MTPGRNERCPCGSGRKYKHCCLMAAQSLTPEELAWRRVRRSIEHLTRDIVREAIRHFGPDAEDEAWDALLGPEQFEPFEFDSPYVPLFYSWFAYDWLPDPHDTSAPEHAMGITAARAYLARAGRRLDPIARAYIEACSAEPFSFYEVIACESGRRLLLGDVLLGGEHDVLERMASSTVKPGDVLYAKLIPIEGIVVMEAIGPAAIPPVRKPTLIEMRRKLRERRMPPDADTLREHDFELRELYLDIADALLYPEMPALQNTDGDPLEMHTLVFDLDAPEQAVESLRELAAGAENAQGVAVERDADGRFTGADIVWSRKGSAMHAVWENTTLGTIRINRGRLTAHVNSAKRAATLRALIEQRLGSTARARPGMIESVESALGRTPTPREVAQRSSRDRDQAAFAAQPEVQQALRDYMFRHYTAWLDDRIPALGGRTPRDAVRDPDGREAVEALITQIERDGVRMAPPLDPGVVAMLRDALGLEKCT